MLTRIEGKVDWLYPINRIHFREQKFSKVKDTGQDLLYRDKVTSQTYMGPIEKSLKIQKIKKDKLQEELEKFLTRNRNFNTNILN